MTFIPKAHEIYRHFKGDLYQVLAVAQHSETGEELVIYQAMYGDFRIYARPLEMFISPVDREKYPQADQEFRFQLQGPEASRQRAESRSEGKDGSPSAPRGESLPEGKGGSPSVPWGESLPEGKDGSPSAPPESAGGLAGEKETSGDAEPAGDGQPAIDPMVLEFLDADTHEERLNILTGLHHRITDGMITTMAIACDVEVPQGDLEERYEELKNCLVTLDRFEIQRPF